MNSCTFTGYVTKDPESNGTAVKFAFAENNKHGEVETTTWINCVAFKAAADQAKDLKKGDWAVVNGIYQTSEHEGKTYPQFIIFKVESSDMWKRRKLEREGQAPSSGGQARQAPYGGGQPQGGQRRQGGKDDFIEDDIPF